MGKRYTDSITFWEARVAGPVYLIDGSSFLYRAYYALGTLTSPSGEPVQAVFGFCRMTKKLFDRFSPEYLAVVWDSPGKTTRHKLFDGYKAARQKQPSDMADQKVYIQEFLRQVGVAQIAEPGIEADDLIASYAKALVVADCDVVVVTSDKDLAQLVDDRVQLFDPFKDALLDRDALEVRYGFPLERLAFYYSLIGDSSDSIPGVRGIGPKTATGLVARFAGLDLLYEYLEDAKSSADTSIKSRTRTLLAEGKESAYLSYKLFLLQSVPVTKKLPSDLRVNVARYADARPLFSQLGFTSLLSSLPRVGVAEAAQGELFGGMVSAAILPEENFAKTHGYKFFLVTTSAQLLSLIEAIRAYGIVAIDTETDGCAVRVARLLGISFCVKPGVAYYLPCAHATGERQLSWEEIVSSIGPILQDSSIRKIFHNAKFDLLVLETAGFICSPPYFDTMLAAGLLRGEGQKIGLKVLSDELLGQPMHHFADLVQSAGRKTFAEVPIALALDYAAADAHQTFLLYELFLPQLKEAEVERLFYDIEMPLVMVLAAMERSGMHIDLTRLEEADEIAKNRLLELEKEIAVYAKSENGLFNPRSPKQVGELLFVRLGLPPIRRTGKSGAFSTDNDSLIALRKEHPVVDLIIRHRELSKLKGTYINGLRDACDSQTNRIYTSFRQATVATGRLSSADPNLQNIPTGVVEGISVRSFFVARAGCTLISADYSQVELRVLAYLSQDPVLCDAFAKGEDIHARTAAGLFGVSIANVSYEQRQLAKRINFSILYGLTPYGLSKDLGIGMSEARSYLDRYQEQYPRVFTWMQEVITDARQTGFVRTYMGRVRRVPELREANKMLYQQGCRVAVNTVAQGTAAELVKMGMIAVHKTLIDMDARAKMVLQVHDEVIIEVDRAESAQIKDMVKKALEAVVDWDVPLIVETEIGDSWDKL